MGLSIQEFWGLTWSEYWQLHEGVFGKQVKPMTKTDLKNIERAWTNGDFRRTGSKSNRRDIKP